MTRRRSVLSSRLSLLGAWSAALVLAVEAHAQPAPEPSAGPQPAPEPLGPGQPAESAPDPLRTALAPRPGGLTLETVSREAIITSGLMRGKQAELDLAGGQVSQTVVQFFPRLTLNASYTRLGEVDSPSLGGGGAVLGSANAGPITVGPCPGDPTTQCVLDSGGGAVQAQPFSFSFPTVLNQIQFSANLTVPISDYFLRAVQAYAAAEHNEEALNLQTEAQAREVATGAKLKLLQWILATGQVVVAGRSVESARAQLKDAKITKEVGHASLADVMRIEALLAQAEFTQAEALSLALVAEHQLRLAIHADAARPIVSGVDVLAGQQIPPLGPLEELVLEAQRNRLELRANEAQRRSLEEVESTTSAGYWPRLDGFANLVLANPNPRIVPSQERFDFTWDVGARLSWTVNDAFSTIGASTQARARTAQIDAQKQLLGEAIRAEVVQAYADALKAPTSLESADRGVFAAEEALRVTKQLFALGRATGTALADAETSVTSARLRKLSAQVGLAATLVRLEHALGRDRVAASAWSPR